MASAGRVAIVPKGDYNLATTYKKLDLVRYNNNGYIAKKPNTGVLPTDETTWMLCIENLSQAKYDELISGTTPAGNSNLLQGLTAEEVGESGARNLIPYPYVNTTASNNGIAWTDNGDGTIHASGVATSDSDFILLPHAKVVLRDGVYTISGMPDDSSSTTYYLYLNWYKDGTYEKITAFTKDTTFALTEDDINAYTFRIACRIKSGQTVDLTFKPMLEIGSVAHDYVPYHLGGAEHALDADTVDGYHASEFASSRDFVSVADYAYIENRNVNAWYRLQLQNGMLDLWETTDQGVTWTKRGTFSTTADLANYLPLTGGTLSGNNLFIANGYGGQYADDNSIQIASRNTPNGNTSRFLEIKNSNYDSNVNTALLFRDMVNGVITDYNILHTGNIGQHALTRYGAEAVDQVNVLSPNHTNDTAITRVLCANQGVSYLTNTLPSYTVVRQISLEPKNITDNPNDALKYQYTEDGSTWYNVAIHHDLNSAKVLVSNTAPSDTAAVWVDTANNKVKAYKDGAWTALA